jgi:hypothetical protein
VAQVVNGRYTARKEEPLKVFIIGMRLPLHKDPAAFDCGVKRTRSTGIAHNVPTVWSD